MTVREYAVLDPWGAIITVVTTMKSRFDVQRQWPSHKVMLLADVPGTARRHYQFWEERP